MAILGSEESVGGNSRNEVATINDVAANALIRQSAEATTSTRKNIVTRSTVGTR
jgi:hypothetical protein